MSKTKKLLLIKQMLESAEASIHSAKETLYEIGGRELKNNGPEIDEKDLKVLDHGRIIEGVFDGQNMIGPDGNQYPVPANYASKSKLISGDTLKLTVAEDGSFLFKQINPIERKKIIGTLAKDEKENYRVIVDDRAYNVLLASVTYFHAQVGDKITIIVPKDKDSEWGAIENVVSVLDEEKEGKEES